MNVPLFAFLASVLAKAKESSQGTVASVIGGLIVGIVMLFVGLFMIDAVDTATNLSATSSFLTTRNNLISTTGTIFTVLGLVIIVVALATAINSLRQMS